MNYPSLYRFTLRSFISLIFFAMGGVVPAMAGAIPPTVSGTQAVAGTFRPGTVVTYTATLVNNGSPSGDKPGHEFTEVLPSGVALIGATASAGTVTATVATNTVEWDGNYFFGNPITITITATVLAPLGQTVSAQGSISFDADFNGTNETTVLTDDSSVAGPQNPTNFTVTGAVLQATQTASGTFKGNNPVTYTVVITNSGNAAQPDNAEDEFVEALPAQLFYNNGSVSGGTLTSTGISDTGASLLHWNGAIPAGGSVTITINATVKPEAAGQIVTAQGILSYDADGDGTNEASALTDDPSTEAIDDANVATVESVLLSASQTVRGLFTNGAVATYTVTLTNNGNATQPDNAGNEFAETLPSSLTLLSASATSGTAVATIGTNTVAWNGTVAAGGSVTITIRATIGGAAGDSISAQGNVSFDSDLDGANESGALTFRPPLLEDPEPTVFTVRSFNDFAFVAGSSKAVDFPTLTNDFADGTPASYTVTPTNGQYGNVTVNADGTLHYTPTGKIPAGGKDTFTYTVDAGSDGSYTATVTVHDFAAAAAIYNGLVSPVDTDRTAETSGLTRITVTKTGAFTGSLVLGGQKFAITGKLDGLGTARFGKSGAATLDIKRPVPRGQSARPVLKFALQVPPNDALDTVDIGISQNDFAHVSSSAERAVFTAKKNPVPPLMNLSAAALGKYTVVFSPQSAPNGGLDATQYPRGTGFGLLTVAPSGVVTLKGALADGTPISYANTVGESGLWPFYVALYKAKGAITGVTGFDSAPPDVELVSAGVSWFRPPNSKAPQYPSGWPNAGITVQMTGDHFTGPQKGVDASILPGLLATSPTGNAVFTVAGGGLSAATPISVNVDTKNKVQFISAPAGVLPKLVIAPTGLITGSFVHPVTHKTVKLRGVIEQATERIDGFFLGATEGGSVSVVPN